MSADEPADPLATYAFKPRPFGREVRFALYPDQLEVDDQRRKVRIPLAAVTMARLTFEPRNSLARGYRLRLSIDGRRGVALSSHSWRSIADAESRGPAYRAFVLALLPVVARANPGCRFLGGRSPIVWAGLVLVTLALLGALVWIVWRSAPIATNAVVLFFAAFAAAFAWVAIDLVARNRPRRVAPSDPPPDLLP